MTGLLTLLVRYKFSLAVAGAVVFAGLLAKDAYDDIGERAVAADRSERAAEDLADERAARLRADSIASVARDSIAEVRAAADSVVAEAAERLAEAEARVPAAQRALATAGANLDATVDSVCVVLTVNGRPLCNSLRVQVAGERGAARDLRDLTQAQITALSEQVTAQAEIIVSQDELEAIREAERAAWQAELDAIATAYEAELARTDELNDSHFYDGPVTVAKWVLAVGGGACIADQDAWLCPLSWGG